MTGVRHIVHPMHALHEQRKQQVLDMLKAKPGQSGAGIERSLGFKRGCLQSVIRNLRNDGRIEVQGKGSGMRLYAVERVPREMAPVSVWAYATGLNSEQKSKQKAKAV